MGSFEEVFSKLAFVLLVAWVVMAGLGLTTLPGARKKALLNKPRRQKASGSVWAIPVTQAPDAEDNLAYPAARLW